MRRAFGRVAWWLIAYERPRARRDYAALAALAALALLGALLLAWPWLLELISRVLASAWSLFQAGAQALLERLRSVLPLGA